MTDAVVVGAGPNGLAAAITLARAGRSVVVVEAAGVPGGACRSGELTEPGHVHDLGSAIHPLTLASPFFAGLDLGRRGVEWVRSPAAVAHAIEPGRAAIAWNDLERTADELGVDASRYRSLLAPFVHRFDDLASLFLAPVPSPSALRHPLLAVRFAGLGILPAVALARRFESEEAASLLLGHAAHASLPLTAPFTSAFALVLGAAAHAVGWPFPRGGASSITAAMVSALAEAGGRIEPDHPVTGLDDLPPAEVVVFALTPRQVLAIAGDHLPGRVRRRLGRFRYGPAAFKVDFALSEPVPWARPDLGCAATVHLGGPGHELVRGEAAVAAGHTPDPPFVLFAQHTRFDPTRAPAGCHTGWAYCHVPLRSTRDMTAAIIARIERFAPGFGDTIVAARPSGPAELEAMDANLVGGDIGGGSYAGRQVVFRPGVTLDRYHLGVPGWTIASASTPPGAGVHAMSGHLAALAALRSTRR